MQELIRQCVELIEGRMKISDFRVALSQHYPGDGAEEEKMRTSLKQSSNQAIARTARRLVSEHEEVAFTAMPLEDMLARMRNDGWSVSIHNDYFLTETYPDGTMRRTYMTYWHFTRFPFSVKGEAQTDCEAVIAAFIAARALLRK